MPRLVRIDSNTLDSERTLLRRWRELRQWICRVDYSWRCYDLTGLEWLVEVLAGENQYKA